MERIDFELGELQAFVAVAGKLNFKAAAEGLFLSQPALSRRIDKLEQTLGARLLERTTRRVALTEAGAHFLAHARSALEELDTAMAGLTERRALRHGLVTVACVHTAASRLLAPILAGFARDFPDVRIRVLDGGAPEVLAQVVAGGADFGIDFLGAQEPDIQFQGLSEDPFVLVMRRGHPLAARDAVPWADLAGERLISVSTGSGNRTVLDHALARLPLRPEVFHEATHVGGALALVEAGLGMAALPELALPARGRSGLVGVPLVEPVVTRTLGLISRKGRHLSPAAAVLYGLLAKAPSRI